MKIKAVHAPCLANGARVASALLTALVCAGCSVNQLYTFVRVMADMNRVKEVSFGTDPAEESNWMINRDERRILSRQEYLKNLEKQKSRLEKALKLNAVINHSEAVSNSLLLLPIYNALALTKEGDALAERLEKDDYEAAKDLLTGYYESTGNNGKLLDLLMRSNSKLSGKDSPVDFCQYLVDQGNLYYRMGDINQAGELYKKAHDFGFQQLKQCQKSKGSPDAHYISAMSSYACFLAAQGRTSEAICPMANSLLYFDHCLNKNDRPDSDNLGSFVSLGIDKDPKLFTQFYKRWQSINPTANAFGVLSKSGQELSKQQFGAISPFAEGLAPARERPSGKVGYIDKTGKWIIKPIFTAANSFGFGRALVRLSPNLLPVDYPCLSMIDRQGKVVQKLPYRGIRQYNDEISIGVRNYNLPNFIRDITDRSGEILFSGTFDGPLERDGNHFTLHIVSCLKQTGCIREELGFRAVVHVEPDATRPGHFKLVQENLSSDALGAKQPETLVACRNLSDRNNVDTSDDPCHIVVKGKGFVLVNKKDQIVSKAYKKIDRLSSEWFRTRVPSSGAGLIDANGKEAIAPRYTDIRGFSEGLAAFQKGKLWGFIDSKGKEVIAAKYDQVGDFNEGLTYYRRH